MFWGRWHADWYIKMICVVLQRDAVKCESGSCFKLLCITSEETWRDTWTVLILRKVSASHSGASSIHRPKARIQPVTSSLQDGLSDRMEEGEQQDIDGLQARPSPLLSERQCSLEGTEGRNRGKGPGKRWVYCPSILLDVTDAHCLALFFFSGNILSEHLTSSVTLLQQHSEMRLLMCPRVC